MNLELFTVCVKEDGIVELEINEEIVNVYGMKLSDFTEQLKTENIIKGIEDFISILKSAN